MCTAGGLYGNHPHTFHQHTVNHNATEEGRHSQIQKHLMNPKYLSSDFLEIYQAVFCACAIDLHNVSIYIYYYHTYCILHRAYELLSKALELGNLKAKRRMAYAYLVRTYFYIVIIAARSA